MSSILDDIFDVVFKTFTSEVAEEPNVVPFEVGPKSRIRITFNRKLTYSEREQLRADVEDYFEVSGIIVKSSKKHSNQIWVNDYNDADSRTLFLGVAEYVEKNFVNVHPKAVYTEIPRVEV